MGETRPARWTRAEEGRLLAGVCAGFARRFDVSVWLVRGVALLAGFATAGLGVITYVILALLLPSDSSEPRG